VINEQFKFSGKVDFPTFSYLFFFDKNEKRLEQFKFFYLENNKITIDGEYSGFINAAIKGSYQSNLLTEYLSIAKDLQIKRDNKLSPISIDSIVKNIINQPHKRGLSISVDSIKNRIVNQYNKQIKEKETQFLFNKANNQMTLNALLTFKKKEISKDSLLQFYEKLDSTKANSTQGRELYYYASNTNVKEGDKFRDIVGIDLKGNKHKISDHLGKVILLDFWAASCGPCRLQNKTEFQKLTKEYSKSDFILISYSLDTNKEVWKKSSNDDNINWINISDLKGIKGENGRKYTITSMPNSFLIDQNGIIIKSFVGFSRGENIIEKEIDKLL
jgi:peroxiredoxin